MGSIRLIQVMKHLYMFVIDMGVAGLHKYDFGETLLCKVTIWWLYHVTAIKHLTCDKQTTTSILDDDLQASLDFYGKTAVDVIFQQDNNTLAGRPNLGFKTMILKFFYGLINHQTLIPLNTFGVI